MHVFERVSRVAGKNGGGLSTTGSGMLRENLPGIGGKHFRFRLFERIRLLRRIGTYTLERRRHLVVIASVTEGEKLSGHPPFFFFSFLHFFAYSRR